MRATLEPSTGHHTIAEYLKIVPIGPKAPGRTVTQYSRQVVEVVHAVILRDGRIALWAERAVPAGPAERAVPARPAVRRGAAAVPHPFAARPDVPGQPATLTLRLP